MKETLHDINHSVGTGGATFIAARNRTMTAATSHRRARQRSRPGSLQKLGVLSLAALAATNRTPHLPWPCLFASASITHRISSSLSQSSRALVQSQYHRELGGQYAADDQYVNEGAAANYDDAVNEAMAARDEAQGDDGYLNMDYVDMDEVSIMPVSCVN